MSVYVLKCPFPTAYNIHTIAFHNGLISGNIYQAKIYMENSTLCYSGFINVCACEDFGTEDVTGLRIVKRKNCHFGFRAVQNKKIEFD